MNYSEMTEEEINIAVTAKRHDCEEWELSDDNKTFYHCGIDGPGWYEQSVLNYCQNPADIMPIAFENGIGVMPSVGGGWAAMHGGLNGVIAHNANPLRAVAECYLMMGDDTESPSSNKILSAIKNGEIHLS